MAGSWTWYHGRMRLSNILVLVFVLVGVGIVGAWYMQTPVTPPVMREETHDSNTSTPVVQDQPAVTQGYIVRTYDCKDNATLGTFVQAQDPSTLGVEFTQQGVVELRNTLPIQHDDDGDYYAGFGATVRMQGSDIQFVYNKSTYTCVIATPTAEPAEDLQSVL